MSGYLAEYGVKEARRERIIKRALLVVTLAAVVGGALYLQFRNYREKRQVKTFLTALEQHDYRRAYALWGCTDQKPCPDYSYQKFLDDWGPESDHADIKKVRITKTHSCEGGIIQILSFGGDEEVWLWVDRSDKTIGYSPWPMCNPRVPVSSLKGQ